MFWTITFSLAILMTKNVCHFFHALPCNRLLWVSTYHIVSSNGERMTAIYRNEYNFQACKSQTTSLDLKKLSNVHLKNVSNKKVRSISCLFISIIRIFPDVQKYGHIQICIWYICTELYNCPKVDSTNSPLFESYSKFDHAKMSTIQNF